MIRLTAIKVPRALPYRSIAVLAYSEQVGTKRQQGPFLRGLMFFW
jgi:hypothetical protein